MTQQPASISTSSSAPPAAITAPLDKIESALASACDAVCRSEFLREAVRYAVLSGGKRVRPLLVWHACAAAGGEPESSLPAGAAIELVHAFSLVHDDLPAMDDDDLRRGKPTLHVHSGEAAAILAGDSMLAGATLLLCQSYEPALASGLCRELSLGTCAMIDGQVYDTLGGGEAGAGETNDRQRLELIHRSKTGALIRASCRMGGLVAGAGESELNQLGEYADRVGLVFQIVDDLLDVTSTTEHLGKGAGKDSDAGKLTFPGVMGVDASREEAAKLSAEAAEIARSLGPASEPLAQIAEYLGVRTR